jgi:flagellar assembly protein FliH
MRDGFTSLAAMLLPPSNAIAESAEFAGAVDAVEDDSERLCEEGDLVRSVCLFHARIREALEDAVDRLLLDVASEVLARELQLAPVAIERIVDAALQRYVSEAPVRVRVHPNDVQALNCGVPVVGDDSLAHGDAVVELRDGLLDATLGVRLDAVLRAIKG